VIATLAACLCNLADRGQAQERHAPSANRDHVELLYSENDALCRPVARVYDQLSRDHPHTIDWEDEYSALWQSIGLRQPQALDDPLHPLHRDVPRQAYYRLILGGEHEKRLVYLEDVLFSSHGDFGTNIWIFKPHADVTTAQFFNVNPNRGGGPGDQFDAESIGIAVVFSFYASWPPGSKMPGLNNVRTNIRLPYYFKRIATPAELDLPPHQLIARIPGLWPGNSYTIQRIFEFRGSVFFLAENSNNFLVYHLKDDRVDDVCYMSTAEFLKSIGWQGGEIK
jgi:hypothetical protein